MKNRRDFIKNAATAVAGGLVAPDLLSPKARAGTHMVLENEWERHFPPPPRVYERLDQGVFERVIPEIDRFGLNVMFTSPTDTHVPNHGMGYQVYPYDVGGTVIVDGETEGESIEKMIRLPFVRNVYMRTDWRVIQQRPGELNFPEMWKYSLGLAKQLNKTVSFRIMLANTRKYPSTPDFVLRNSGGLSGDGIKIPHYEHPEYQAAFRDFNRMLAAEYDKDPVVEHIDMMGYGQWGEWHVGHPDRKDTPGFTTSLAAVRTLCDMVEEQMDAWRHTPLVMMAHGGLASIRMKDVMALALRGGCWWRRDNLSQAIASNELHMLTHRPPWTAAILEDGRYSNHKIGDRGKREDENGEHIRSLITMTCLDVNGTYWALWQNAEDILKFLEAYPRGFQLLDRHLGYKVRPAWVFVEAQKNPQALIVAIRNDGCSAPPGILRIYATNAGGTFKVGGGFDPGLPGPFSLHQGRIVLPLGVRWEDVRLSAEIEIKGTRHPVRWACAEKLNDDGSITLRPTPGLQPLTRSGWADDDSFAPGNFRYPGDR